MKSKDDDLMTRLPYKEASFNSAHIFYKKIFP